jgi:TonB family protein
MRNLIPLSLASLLLVAVTYQNGLAQQNALQSSAAAAEERSNREQDGLEGPVRRVRVETAKMIVKAGNLVEGPKVVRGIATYDSLGKKIDAVDYPVESSTVPGKERYSYDDKGNIVEMIVVGTDGSILSKEAYSYEFDPMGNWTRMNTSVAVYENGKVTFEPTEVTYRTISYYYNQAIEKLSKAAAKTTAATSAPQPTRKDSALQPAPVNQTQLNPVAEPVAAKLKDSVATSIPMSHTPTNEAPVGTNTVKNEVAMPSETVSKPSVAKVPEAVLRAAATEIPEPDYPQAALLGRISGKVEVQVLVSDKGLVTNARAQSGHTILKEAAEAAALKARFTPSKIAAEPSMAFGVITYNFILPEAPSTTATNTPPVEPKPRPADERKVTTPTTPAETRPATFTQPKPKTTTATEPEATNYSKGLTFLAANYFAEAAAEFSQAVQANPNDANAYAKLAMSLTGMGKDKEALAGYKMAAQISPSVLDAAAYYNWGKSYLSLEKNSDAISAFKQALSLMRAEAIGLEPKTVGMPSAEQLHHYMGTAYINSRRFNDAIKEFKQVVALNPANAEAHFALAIAYFSNGDRRAAEEENKILSTLDAELSSQLTAALGAPGSRFGCKNVACR